jgi:two-component system response regulator RpfG
MPGGLGEGGPPPLQEPGQTIYIVDDQSTGRRILERMVQRIDPGLTIRTFSDAFAALEAAAQRPPDLILTDYKMPELDGVAFIERLRALRDCADVPVIVITVVEDPSVKYRALEAGATEFLVRPVDQYECLVRCRNLLTLRRQQRVIRNHAAWLEEQVQAATRQVLERERETLLRLAKAGEYRDEGTGNHVLRMARYCRLIAEELGLAPKECEEIELAAPMHDIGKIGIPDPILLKPGRLDPEEWEIMKRHTLIGHEILRDSPSRYLQLGAEIALYHHERVDGTGYPHALAGEEIPLAARIVAVGDVFDALTTVRPYKPRWSMDKALVHLRSVSGSHLDSDCVRAFLARVDEVRRIGRELEDPEDGPGSGPKP